ncbi:MAG: response regulator [Alphaproteobacteria bacterium]|nr:response regulator [Alphaproteobacteria bacterium]MBO4644361.1 response regulator [Alphaproteobacteria bacterium]
MSVNKEISVLIVDDYQTMRGVIRNLLRQLGFHNTIEAGTTDEAMQALKEKECGLVIFDWLTGPMSGADFFKEVHKDEKLNKVPFIVVCAESNQEIIADIHQAGVADFIAKPFTEATLKKRMIALFGSF